MTPMPVFYVDYANLRWYLLGFWKDVRYLNIKLFADEEEVNIGGETWVLFPLQKRGAVDGQDVTKYAGFAYRKVTA